MTLANAAARHCGFAINGRFFGQPVTGVQRYAREVVRAVDDLLSTSGRRATVMTPAGEAHVPTMRALDVQRTGPADGHLWEQAVLPARWRGPLLNLCNTAPVMGVKQAVCIHDANVFRMPDSYSRAFRTLYRTLQPLLARRAAKIITVSSDAARQLAEHLPVRAPDIAVLPNGHEHALRWDAGRATVFDAVAQHRPFVLLIGSRARHKNTALALGLAESFDLLGLDLLIAGNSAGVFADDQNSGHSNVRWLGKVTDDDLALLLSRAVCLAFPSFTEGFGLPVLEAMALGCPVISSDRASLPEVCGSAALMASPDDPAAWLDHVERLVGSASLRDELRQRGHLQAACFSWRDTARGYLDLIGDP